MGCSLGDYAYVQAAQQTYSLGNWIHIRLMTQMPHTELHSVQRIWTMFTSCVGYIQLFSDQTLKYNTASE